MIFHLFCLLVGYSKLLVPCRREALITLFLRKKINVADGQPIKGGGYSFVVPLYEKKKLLRLLTAYGFQPTILYSGGLPVYLWSLRKRIGLLLGILSAIGVVTIGSLVLWKVRIVGCETVSPQKIRALLVQHGIEIGGFIPKIDVKASANRILLEEPRISYIAINIIGTCCEVQITEGSFPSPKEEKYPASIIAAYDGLVQRVEVYDGQLAVQNGEAVRKGQVLISGLCDSAEGTYRLESASGVVIAKVEREFCVEVPFVERVTIQKSEQVESHSLIFFKKSVKLSKTSSIFPPTYGTIIKKEAWTLPGGLTLPIALQTVLRTQYETVERHRTAADAAALAKQRMEDLVARELKDAEVLSLTAHTEETETGVRLVWQIYCLMDIGVVSPMIGVPK